MGNETLDLRGTRYTIPVVRLAKAMKAAEPGTRFEVLSDYPAFERELDIWCGAMGHRIEEISTTDGVTRAVVVKG